MAVDRAALRRAQYTHFLDPQGEEGEADYDLVARAGLPADVLRAELAEAFERLPDAQRIGVLVDGQLIGIGTRVKVLSDSGLAGPSMGDGDGLSFPLDPGEFRAIRFECRTPGCDRRAFAAFYDERRIPECPADGELMVLTFEG